MSILQYDYQKKLEEVLSTGKKKSYFVAAITVFFILLMSFAGIIPALSSLGTQHEENAKRDVIIGKLENKLNTLKGFVQEEDSKKNVLSFLDYVFPNKFPEKDSLNKVYELTQKDHVTVNSYVYSDPQPGVQDDTNGFTSKNTKVLALSFGGSGLFSDIQTFVKDLEDSRRILNIVDLSITKTLDPASELPTADNMYSFSVGLYIYWYDTSVD